MGIMRVADKANPGAQNIKARSGQALAVQALKAARIRKQQASRGKAASAAQSAKA